MGKREREREREREGMNAVVMTIINLWKEYLLSQGSNHRPPVLKFCTLPVKLHGLGSVIESIPKGPKDPSHHDVSDQRSLNVLN